MTSPAPGPITVHVFGRTDVGRTREHNEDAFVVADLSRNNATLQPEVRTHTVGPKGTLFMVADGMGGAAAGEIASAMAIDVVINELQGAFESLEPDNEQFAAALKRATAAANVKIHQFALDHPEYRGMGTTATIAGLLGDTLYLAQVGDSRGYLVRNGTPRQITKDQSLMQKLIEAGEITEEEAETSERRNIILQAIGPESAIKVDLTFQKVRKGDTLVICSDGLSGQVRIDEIGRVVENAGMDLMQACKQLIDRANEAGGPDNITVIVARFEGEGLTSVGENDDVGHHVFALTADSGQTPAQTTRPTAAAASVEEETHRPTVKIPSLEIPMPPEIMDKRLLPTQRGRKASMFMLILTVLFLAVATWVVYGMVKSFTDKKAQPAPAPSTELR